MAKKPSLKEKMRAALGSAVRGADAKTDAKPEFLATGFAGLDYALGGGIMWGRLTEVFGESTVGKSLLQDVVLIETQKLGGVAAKFNTEHAHNPNFFAQLGGNNEDLLLYPDPEEEDEDRFIFIEDVFTKMDELLSIKVVDGDTDPVAIAWDSIAATLPRAVADVDMAKLNMKHNLARAMAMSNCVPRIHYLVQQSKAIVIASNQIRESPDAFERDTRTPGGLTFPFFASQRIELRKGKTIKADNGEPVGHMIVGKIVKNRLDAALRTFCIPCYTRSDLPHPIYDLPLTPGLHKMEALWEFCIGRKLGGDEKSTYVPYFTLPDGLPVITVEKPGWYKLHAVYGGKSVRKADWPLVLEEYPNLWLLPKVSA